jgi:hypothetical protein
MSEHAGSDVGLAEGDNATTIEIDLNDRWDALRLSEELISFHSFLVQYGAQRWVVHARAPGCRGEDLADALTAIDDWIAEYGSEAVACRIGGRPRQLTGSAHE